VAWLLGTLVSLVGADLDTVRITLAKPWNAILFSLFLLAMFWHAKLGLQVVIEDYVHERAVEITLQLLVTLACVVGALASLYAIGRIAFLA
jgi:succinate dehydrogenase / fumarate reductase membrane anchor subunit